MVNGGPAASADLSSPLGVAVDAAGNVYIADTGNHAIRKVNELTGDISLLVKDSGGTDSGGTYYLPSKITFYPVALYGPVGLYLDGNGNLYVADSFDMLDL
jgi:DNA-binding beta-propeller fold protein YncE